MPARLAAQAADLLDRSGFPHCLLRRSAGELASALAEAGDAVVFGIGAEERGAEILEVAVQLGRQATLRAGSGGLFLFVDESAEDRWFWEELARRHGIGLSRTLSDALRAAWDWIGQGDLRSGGEREVPLDIWRLPQFQQWLGALKRAGNRLDGFSPRLRFRVGPGGGWILCWGALVKIWVSREERHKSNELVLSRPDIHQVVAYHWPESGTLLDVEVLLVREFRSNAVTGDGFIRETPGGSGNVRRSGKQQAVRELEEETGLVIAAGRLRALAPRQPAGTSMAFLAHGFAVRLTAGEMRQVRRMGRRGNAVETERTYPEIRTVRALLRRPLTDWANLGMILTALVDLRGGQRSGPRGVDRGSE